MRLGLGSRISVVRARMNDLPSCTKMCIRDRHAPADALDAVGAGFVHGLARGDVALNLLVGELIERHVGHIDKRQALGGVRGCGVSGSNDADAGCDLVRAPRELVEHGAGFVLVCRLTQNLAIEGDDGVGRNGQLTGIGVLGGNGGSLGAS